MFTIESMRMREFRKQYWISWKPLISWLLRLDLDNFRCIFKSILLLQLGFA